MSAPAEILLIDDDPDVQRMVATSLQEVPLRLSCVHDSVAGLSVLRLQPIDLIAKPFLFTEMAVKALTYLFKNQLDLAPK